MVKHDVSYCTLQIGSYVSLHTSAVYYKYTHRFIYTKIKNMRGVGRPLEHIFQVHWAVFVAKVLT